ncbi:MAG: serine/threonine protein phosphatase [Magnetococcales bacterium]|nr:serine/threonine protein phosphatase [Magnetococcales bacterium]
MSRLIAIGDIHGEYDKLRGLLDRIQPTPDDQLVFLGDYIDRGPKSCEVVLCLMDLLAACPRTILLQGNHEQCMLDHLVGSKAARWQDDTREGWPDGGAETLASYRQNQISLRDHLPFFTRMPLSWTTETFFFCHAGIHPQRALDAQRPSDLLHIRHPFLSWPHPLPKIIVHGHSYTPDPFAHPHRIGLDTGSRLGGPLTAVILPEKSLLQFT